MRIEGTIKSYVAAKRFGFIDGADGESYFFHMSDFQPRRAPHEIRSGLLVTLDPTPTPKGLRGKKIRVERRQSVIWDEPSEFLVIEERKPKRVAGICEVPLLEVESRDGPRGARSKLVKNAKGLGANAVLEASYSRRDGHEGNYTYTVHQYSGRPALVMEERYSLDLDEISKKETEVHGRAEQLRSNHQAYCECLERKRRDRARGRAIGCFVAVLFAFALLGVIWLLVLQ